MKKLPEIYKSNITKNIKNNKEVCYLKNIDTRNHNLDVEDVINDIFSGIGYAYNIPVIIDTMNKKYETSLVAKSKDNVVTLDNEVIAIKDIINIKRLK